MDKKSWARIRTPGYQIRRLHQLSVAVFLDCLQHVNLTPIQYTILVIIDMEPGVEQTSIASRAGLDASTVADVVKRLVKHGMIKREVGIRDKRSRVAFITSSGKVAITDAAPLIEDAIQSMLSPLAIDEQQNFLSMIDRILIHNTSEKLVSTDGRPWQRELRS